MASMSDPQYPAPSEQAPLGASQPMRISGLHHATLICSDLERTTAFYRDVLGLALADEGVNADDPATRHFWFTSDPNAGGSEPALRLTFLEYPEMAKATQGVGGVHHLALAVASADEVEAWRDYLQQREIPTTASFSRDKLRSVYLRDPDGQIIEIVAPGE